MSRLILVVELRVQVPTLTMIELIRPKCSVPYRFHRSKLQRIKASRYHNEKECGRAIRKFLENNQSAVSRDDIWYTTKLASNSSFAAAQKSIDQSLKTCGFDQIDLFLLHSPYGGKKARLESWRAIEDAIIGGKVKTGGVSNFGVKHVSVHNLSMADAKVDRMKLQELLDSKPRVLPAVNQIEVHPFNTRTEICDFCQKNGIVVEAYAPLVRALRMKHPVVVSLSQTYRCTPGQLLIRWSLQHGYVPLPKSVHEERIIENGQIEHFNIDIADMENLDNLDEYLVTGERDPMKVNLVVEWDILAPAVWFNL